METDKRADVNCCEWWKKNRDISVAYFYAYFTFTGFVSELWKHIPAMFQAPC